jgi:IclR family pca regulon transcriptional regulator
MGKAILAFMPDADIEAFLATAPFEKFTEHTVITADAMRARLKQIRDKGYDSAFDELDFGIVSVAVPVFDASRRAIAAVNCSTSTTRISQEDLIASRLPLLREAAAEIESALRRWPSLAFALKADSAT